MLPSNRRSVRASLGRWVDIVLVGALTAVGVVSVAVEAPALLRIPLALALVVFVPGYALTVAVFPRTRPADAAERTEGDDAGIDAIERAVLAVGLSVGTVPLFAIAIERVFGRLTASGMLAALLAVTAIALVVGVVQRLRLPTQSRRAPFVDWTPPNPMVSDGGFRRPDALTVIVVVCLVFAGGAVAYSQTDGASDAGITELYLLTEEPDGDLVASNYPSSVAPGEERTLWVGIGNEEGERVQYTVVGVVQRETTDGGTSSFVDVERFHEDAVTVEHNATTTVETSFDVDEPGRYRVVYLLYVGDAPSDPGTENAYREVHIWVTVGEDGETTSKIAADESMAGSNDRAVTDELDPGLLDVPHVPELVLDGSR